MTIHSDWSRILHDECSDAFSRRAPTGRMQVGVIDGHLQLMRLDPRMGTWDTFIRNQFLKPIETLFHLGCPRVALCFDNYGAVPAYKSMTQAARSGRHEVKVFHAHDALPATIPEDPMLFLMNRHFKLKLIEMLCERIPPLVGIERGQEFILDYKRVVSYTHGPRVPAPVRDMECMGESDVKFCRYVTRYGSALVHAVDGDYMAIALLYYAHRGVRDDNRIFIYRQLSVLPSRKRKQPEPEEEELVFFRPAPVKAAPKCWVDMQMVFATLARAVRRGQTDVADQDAVFSMVFLMLCAGTDFSRNVPLLGPKRMWEALPKISAPLVQAVRGEGALNSKAFLNLVIGRMYAMHYSRHVSATYPLTLATVLDALHRSRLSNTTKGKLPTPERMATTLRNVEWVIRYWSTENGAVETPCDGACGYSRAANGEITFADLA
jgi:hypothetical protein